MSIPLAAATVVNETWLWIGFAGMAAGAILIAMIGTTLPAKERHHAIASFFVCLIATAAYFAMATGAGSLESGRGIEVFFARYVDWAFTTPLLLVGLLMVGLPSLRGGGEDGRERNALIGGVIAADVFMVVTGFVAALTGDETNRYVWYGLSCLGFLIVLVAVWGPVYTAAKKQGGETKKLWVTLASVLTVLWFIYPIVWILGTEGQAIIDLKAEITIFAIVDLLAKVGFGLLLVTGVKKIYSKRPARRNSSSRKSTARKSTARRKTAR